MANSPGPSDSHGAVSRKLPPLAIRVTVHASATKRSSDFAAHLEQLDHLYGPVPGKPTKLVEDNGPIHTSKLSLAALAARAHWLTVEWLPKHAPELNDIEAVWQDLKAHHLAHQTFPAAAPSEKPRRRVAMTSPTASTAARRGKCVRQAMRTIRPARAASGRSTIPASCAAPAASPGTSVVP